MRTISPYIVAAFIHSVRIFLRQSKRTIRGTQVLLHRSACALQQPRIQYRMALLLATLIVFLLGYTLFLPTLPHISFARLEYW